MSLTRLGVLLLVLILTSCGRSKVAQFYVLNPVCAKPPGAHVYTHLHIGLSPIRLPAYLRRPEISMRYPPHKVQLEENNQWAEGLDQNISRVIRVNLNTLLPGSIVEVAPWDRIFHPNYELVIIIDDFVVDSLGVSNLRLQYLIYHDEKLIKKADRSYHLGFQPVTIDAAVGSMNSNLTSLSLDLAKFFREE